MYGIPILENAALRIWRCQSSTCGRVNTAARLFTCAICQLSASRPKLRICAAEYAASARVAGSCGRSSRESCAAGWLRRRPSKRATTSVPKRLGTARPSARAPCTSSLAAFLRPIACTRLLSSCAIVSGALDEPPEVVVVVPVVVVAPVVPVVVSVEVPEPEPLGGEDDV